MASRSEVVLRVALLPLLVAAAACSSDVDIIGRCTLDGEPLLVGLPMGTPSVAVAGERLFMSVTRDSYAYPTESGEPGSEGFGGWIGDDGAVLGDTIDFGAGFYFSLMRTKWSRTSEGGLVGLVGFEPARDVSRNPEQLLHRWYIDAETEAPARHVRVDATAAEGGVENGWVPGLGTYTSGIGVDAIWPTVEIGGNQYSAFVEKPLGTACAAPLEVMLVGEDDVATPVHTVDCSSLDAAIRSATGAPTLFDPGDGTIGALVRMGAADDIRLRIIRFHPDGTLVTPPRVVGQGEAQGPASSGGLLARVARVPGNRLIVAERDGGGNYCHMLTVMARDGSESERADWQPPCVGKSGYEVGQARTTWVELVEVPGGAVFIWEEAAYVGLYLTDQDPWFQHINAVLITPDGKRGSEIVTVTAPESTVVGPIGSVEGTAIPQHFLGHADSDGNHVAVAWGDLRADAPGLYARHLRCVVDAED